MKYNIVDGHCDTPMELYLRQEDLQDNTCQVSLSRAQTLAGLRAVLCVLHGVARQSAPASSSTMKPLFPILTASWTSMPAASSAAEPKADARAAIAGGKCGAFLSIEGAEAISCDPGKLELAYEQGVRMIAPLLERAECAHGSIVSGGG